MKRSKEAKRSQIEREHGRKIIDEAESVWGWATRAGRLRMDRRARLISEHIFIDNENFILEIGCGTGEATLRFLKNKFPKLVSIDISLELILKAREKASRAPKKAFYVVADAENLPFKENVFHAVIGSSILHHLDEYKVVPQFKRILPSGGNIVFAEPNLLNPQIFIVQNSPILRRKLAWTDTEKAFSRWHIKRVLEHFGFREVTVKPFGFLHPLVPKQLISACNLLEYICERAPLIREISGSLLIAAKNTASHFEPQDD